MGVEIVSEPKRIQEYQANVFAMNNTSTTTHCVRAICGDL